MRKKSLRRRRLARWGTLFIVVVGAIVCALLFRLWHLSWVVRTELETRHAAEKNLLDSLSSSMVIALLGLVAVGFAIVFLLLWSRATRLRHARIERLISSIGHDLRSPLHAIQSSATILVDPKFSGRSAVAAGILHSSIATVNRLVDDLVQLAKKEELSYVATPQDLSVWWLDFASPYVERARAKGLEWSASADIPWTYVSIDAERLKQVCGNLVENAIKYTDQGRIQVYLELHLGRSHDSNGHELKFSVIDSGIGIRKEDLKRVFKPFQRSQNALSRSGSGLGLSIVRSIVEDQGGEVFVASELGKGSTFSVSLPVKVIAKVPS